MHVASHPSPRYLPGVDYSTGTACLRENLPFSLYFLIALSAIGKQQCARSGLHNTCRLSNMPLVRSPLAVLCFLQCMFHRHDFFPDHVPGSYLHHPGCAWQGHHKDSYCCGGVEEDETMDTMRPLVDGSAGVEIQCRQRMVRTVRRYVTEELSSVIGPEIDEET